MSANGISTLSTKQAKQTAKLNLAQLKRQGYTLAADGTVLSGPDTTKNFYRTRNEYNLEELPTQYSGNNLVDNVNEDGLLRGRPWFVPTPYPAGTVPFLEMNNGTNDMGDLLDSTATYTSNGFILNSGLTLGSAVVLRNLSITNDTWFDTQPNNSGYVWTATWAVGSTYASTPVSMYYEGFGPETVFFFILDPSDLTYSTPVDTGTFNFPVVFTPGSTPTTFGSP
jgi:hypothetical protein